MRATVRTIRRFALSLFLPLALWLHAAYPAAADITVTDIVGRQVTLPAAAKRLVLGEARHMAVLDLLHRDPVALVVGWRLDKGLDQPTFQAYRKAFPAIDAIRSVGSGNRDISAETVIALKPDLLVLSLMDQGDPVIRRASEQIEAAGIPIVYVDFFAHPLENSLPSLEVLGKLTGAEDSAAEFAQFYRARLDRITDRLEQDDPSRPSVFFHVHAAPTGCCATVGGGVFDEFVSAAGGRNIAAQNVKGVLGNVSLEFLIGADPDFYVATGGTHMEQRGGLVLGTGVAQDRAAASFADLIGAPGFSSLRAVRDGDAAGVWHLFNDSPVHIALIEYLARLFHPTLFDDIDPDETLAQIDARFLSVAVPGSWWVREAR